VCSVFVTFRSIDINIQSRYINKYLLNKSESNKEEEIYIGDLPRSKSLSDDLDEANVVQSKV
jgi:hypothetical protein